MPINGYLADVDKWTAGLKTQLNARLQTSATWFHGRIVGRTPYYTGRACASWNFNADQVDPTPAPPLPFPVKDALHLTAMELAQANAFYNPISDQKHATVLPPTTQVVFISNNVEYIELLNSGWSKQAPAMFYQLTVGELALLLER